MTVEVSAVSSAQEKIDNDITIMKNGMKVDISAVKNHIEDKIQNSISAVKGDVSAMETKINAGQEELRQEICAFQERIKAGQAEFEESVTCTFDTQLKSVTIRVLTAGPGTSRSHPASP
jgi:hypothetical protein